MSQRDLIHKEKRNNSDIDRVLYDYYSEWNNHDDRRSCCLRQRFGHVGHSSIVGSFSSCALARKFSEEREYSYDCKETVPHTNQGWQNCPLHVGKLCTDSGTWSHCLHTSPKRYTARRPGASVNQLLQPWVTGLLLSP